MVKVASLISKKIIAFIHSSIFIKMMVLIDVMRTN